MPTFKHPCPHCGKYVNRDVAACPFCGTRDPFAPARCPSCRTAIADRSWVACPNCGQELGGRPVDARAAASEAERRDDGPGRQDDGAPAQANASAGGRCTGCGAAMPANARFCTVCGTLAD
jgi:rRNA maturation endonuclease Nob1